MSIDEISPELFAKLIGEGADLSILDVREQEEFKHTSVKDSYLIPMMEVESRTDEIRNLRSKEEIPLVVVCRSGGRSAMVTEYLKAQGFTNVLNLKGGINELSFLVDYLKPY